MVFHCSDGVSPLRSAVWGLTACASLPRSTEGALAGPLLPAVLGDTPAQFFSSGSEDALWFLST